MNQTESDAVCMLQKGKKIKLKKAYASLVQQYQQVSKQNQVKEIKVNWQQNQKQNDNFGITLKRPETGLKFMLEKNSNHLVINNTQMALNQSVDFIDAQTVQSPQSPLNTMYMARDAIKIKKETQFQ